MIHDTAGDFNKALLFALLDCLTPKTSEFPSQLTKPFYVPSDQEAK